MRRALVLGYYMPSRFENDLILLKKLARYFEFIIVPSMNFKLGFNLEKFDALKACLNSNLIFLENIEEFCFRNFHVTVFSRNHILRFLLNNSLGVTYIETYGGFDLKYQSRVKYVPKSKFSFYFNQGVLGVFRKPPKTEIGPIWYCRKGCEPAFQKKPSIGLFTKNLFLVRDKARAWRGARIGNEYFKNHLMYVGRLLDVFPDLKIFPHPNAGEYEEKEREWYLSRGVLEKNICKSSSQYKDVDIGLGFSTHARADLNWHGRPFVEIQNLSDIQRTGFRGVLSSFRAGAAGMAGIASSKSFPYFYGATAPIQHIGEVVEQIADSYDYNDCCKVGDLLLGPDLALTERVRIIAENN